MSAGTSGKKPQRQGNSEAPGGLRGRKEDDVGGADTLRNRERHREKEEKEGKMFPWILTCMCVAHGLFNCYLFVYKISETPSVGH